MDQFDAATEREMMDRDLAIARARSVAGEAIATGRCLWCDEPVEDGLRWCRPTNPGESCMQEWDYDRKRRATQ